MATIDTGKTGEDRAVSFLLKNGYVVLGRNVRSPMGEIDIVARDHDVVCFIEVRSRTGDGKNEQAQAALASVDHKKQMKLSRLAVSYLKANKLLDRRARFDVVAVLLKDQGEDVVVIKDAFPIAERYA
jgi:putative endonuclease